MVGAPEQHFCLSSISLYGPNFVPGLSIARMKYPPIDTGKYRDGLWVLHEGMARLRVYSHTLGRGFADVPATYRHLQLLGSGLFSVADR
jgi:hypothetical protein